MHIVSYRKRVSRTRRLWRVLGLLVAAFPNSLPAAFIEIPEAVRPGAVRKIIPVPPPEALFEVPPVVERPLDIDDGEKIVVTAFLVEGANDRPEFDINAADVKSIADAKLGERPDGFTVRCLQEVADDITKYYREHGLILA